MHHGKMNRSKVVHEIASVVRRKTEEVGVELVKDAS
jgi:hypothetical protein